VRRLAEAFLRGLLGGGRHGLGAAVLFEAHGFFDQVAGDLLDVAADIADLGELGRFDFDERCIGQLGQAARNLGFAAAGGADHQDILRRHFVAQIGGQLLAAPAIAQRDRDRALGGVLADDMRVEGSHDRFGSQVFVHLFYA